MAMGASLSPRGGIFLVWGASARPQPPWEVWGEKGDSGATSVLGTLVPPWALRARRTLWWRSSGGFPLWVRIRARHKTHRARLGPHSIVVWGIGGRLGALLSSPERNPKANPPAKPMREFMGNP